MNTLRSLVVRVEEEERDERKRQERLLRKKLKAEAVNQREQLKRLNQIHQYE